MYADSRSTKRLPSRANAAAALALAALCFAPRPGAADDRELVRRGQDDPYVFVLLDVSGSMNQSVNCTQEQFDNGDCAMVCPEGACLPRLMGDDPAAKLAVAKEAIYEIMRTTENVHFGFATFDQRQLGVLRKHWWYKVAANQAAGFTFLTLDSGRRYPDVGHEEIFGAADWACTDAIATCTQEKKDAGLCTNLGFTYNDATVRWVGCTLPTTPLTGQPANPIPADLNDAWEWERVRRYPKLDDNNSATRSYYIRDNAVMYKVTFAPVVSQTIGNATVNASVRVDKCNNASCSSITTKGTRTVKFDKADEMLYWEAGDAVNRVPPSVGYYGVANTVRQIDTNTNLSAWDPNTDNTTDDPRDTGTGFKVNMRQDTTTDTRGAVFSVGDVIPLDWKNNQRTRIMQRMAPNTIPLAVPPFPASPPNFRVSPYFADHRQSGESILRLRSTTWRPLAAEGGTPIGGSMESLLNWIKTWHPLASNATTGDPDFKCRQTYLLLITDGLASDGNKSCDIATQLRTLSFGTGKNYPIRSFVVALGLPEIDIRGYDNSLTCVAWNGGTGKTPADDPTPGTLTAGGEDGDGDGRDDGPGPLFPQNKQELVDALTRILSEISGQSRSFAAAAVPSVQANALDKIILSSFTPVNEPIWPGHVNAFVKPIPFKKVKIELNDGTLVDRTIPDPDKICTSADDTGCRAWNAGDELLEQGTSDDDWATDTFNLGLGENQRRVFYLNNSGVTPLQRRRSFVFPTTTPEWIDLLDGMNLCDPADGLCTSSTAQRDDARDAIRYVHKVKLYDDPKVIDQKLPYLLGDVFHSDPVVVGAPAEFRYFAADLYKDKGTNPCGYRCFFRKQRYRRQVLLVGSNDGQLHAFDAGVFRLDEVTPTGEIKGAFDPGSGRELFAYIPRPVLPSLDKASDDFDLERAEHTFKVDGTPVVADVFVDAGDPDGPEWRTVAVGGLREGGGVLVGGIRQVHTGYYALDITQPDELDKALSTDPDEPNGGNDNARVPVSSPGALGYVPSCINGGTDCGPLPYPSVRWEFRDEGCLGLPCDEDLNGEPDLGDTWSNANIGRIRVCEATGCDPNVGDADRFVAVFGGGMDPDKDSSIGNWLYMVDINTGKVLYKRKLDGAAPSEPAAVDTDLDGYLDTVYIATIKGFIYKASLKTRAKVNNLPGLGDRITDVEWDPFKIFDTEGRPIYYPPTILFVASTGKYALAFGTGDRENLWAPSTLTGRFYVILDSNFPRKLTSGAFFTAKKASDYTALTPTSAVDTRNLLEQLNGWYLNLGVGERAITRPFALSGVTAISFYQPQLATVTSGSSVVCANTGTSRIFVLNTTNGNGLLASNGRFRDVKDFVTSPFTEQSQSKNEDDTAVNDENLTAAELAHLEAIRKQLEDLFPKNCKFANQTQDIKAVRSDTGIEYIAPVPMCVIDKNWKEF